MTEIQLLKNEDKDRQKSVHPTCLSCQLQLSVAAVTSEAGPDLEVGGEGEGPMPQGSHPDFLETQGRGARLCEVQDALN